MKLNPIGIIGGIILIISPFLPWVSVLFFNFSLLDILTFGTITADVAYYIILIVLILLVLGGIIALFKGLIGGIIGLIGVLIFTILVFVGGETFAIAAYLGIGYYLAWIGAIICIISIVWKRIAPAPPTPAPLPPPT
ncbi:MAG: hypothetical protein ACPLY9_00775 [Nitrososphaerales archaeon]